MESPIPVQIPNRPLPPDPFYCLASETTPDPRSPFSVARFPTPILWPLFPDPRSPVPALWPRSTAPGSRFPNPIKHLTNGYVHFGESRTGRDGSESQIWNGSLPSQNASPCPTRPRRSQNGPFSSSSRPILVHSVPCSRQNLHEYSITVDKRPPWRILYPRRSVVPPGKATDSAPHSCPFHRVTGGSIAPPNPSPTPPLVQLLRSPAHTTRGTWIYTTGS